MFYVMLGKVGVTILRYKNVLSMRSFLLRYLDFYAPSLPRFHMRTTWLQLWIPSYSRYIAISTCTRPHFYKWGLLKCWYFTVQQQLIRCASICGTT